MDCLLQDIHSSSKPFGGITTVFGGDFQQTLPVVPHGTRADIVHATIQPSPLWNNINILHLWQNMHVADHLDKTAFTQWLLDVGHGWSIDSIQPASSVLLPPEMCCYTEKDLITSVYGSLSLSTTCPHPHFFEHHAILTATNSDVHLLNSAILSLLPSQERTFDSADSYSNESPTPQENNNIPIEFLHTLNASGLPITHLQLKLGCPIIILRNIDISRGLCNGTQATIIQMTNRVLLICLLTGSCAGDTALIPQITLFPSLLGLDFAINLKRRQFPVQLAFAMTINKSQGQTLHSVGIDLHKPVFLHGQLYVALSRATSPQNVKILLPTGNSANVASNVVYNEVLLDR